jgi:excinuclease ABC subunit C
MWQVVGHELVAQLRELELIRRFQPRLNVRGRWPGRPLGYIYLSREDAPRFRLARRVPKGVRCSWGPFRTGWRVREAVELVNQLFKLCDCPASVPMHFADQRQLFGLDLRFGCLRGETGSCLGPCAGHCTSAEYHAQLRAAQAFLDGQDLSALANLEQRLAEATVKLRFEQAARLRDMLNALTTLSERLARLREPAAPSEFVYPLVIGRRSLWLYVSRGIVAASSPAPSTADGSRRCLQLLNQIYEQGSLITDDVDRFGAQIVSSWFYFRPAEITRILRPAEAIASCRRIV